MNPTKDQDLLAFLLGELPLLKRLDIRLRLLCSARARRRLADLGSAADAIAGSIGRGGTEAFRANLGVKLRRLFLIDVGVAAAIVGTIGFAGASFWRSYHQLRTAEECPTPPPKPPEPHGSAGQIHLTSTTTSSGPQARCG